MYGPLPPLLLGFAICGTSGSGCAGCEQPIPPIDPPTVSCDFAAPAFAPPDPCIDGVPIAQVMLDRAPGPPERAVVPFEVRRGGQICVVVQSDGVASANVQLDDRDVFGPSDFNPHVRLLRVHADVASGAHSIAIAVASMPGSSLTVEVRYASNAPSDTEVAAQNDAVQLQRAACDEFNRRLDAMRNADPAQARAFVDGMRAMGIPLGRVAIISSRFGTPAMLGPLPRIDLGVGSDPATVARAWIEAHRALLGIDSPDVELVLDGVVPQEVGAAVVFGERIAGRDVRGGRVVLFIEDTSVVEYQGRLVPDVPVAHASPSLDAAAAVSSAHAWLGNFRGSVAGTTLCVVDTSALTGTGTAALGWVLEGELGNTGIDNGTVVVDAMSGDVLSVQEVADRDLTLAVFDNQHVPEDALLSHPPMLRLMSPSLRGGQTPTGCLGDARCDFAAEVLLEADQFYRNQFGRDGWSDGRGTNSGAYIVDYGWFPPSGNPNPSPYGRLTYSAGVFFDSAVRIPDLGMQRDVIAHEFGHGLLNDGTIRPPVAGDDWLIEHVPDTVALLTSLSVTASVRDPHPFGQEWGPVNAPVTTVRSAFPGECTSDDWLTTSPYALTNPRCDATEIEVAPSPPPAHHISIAQGCREYVHTNFISNLGGDAEGHAQSCILSVIDYLLLQNTGVLNRHGVATAGVSRELATLFYRQMYTHMRTVPQVPNDYWTYGTSYRTAVALTVNKCSAGMSAVSECSTALTLDEQQSLRDTLTAPLLDQGFPSMEAMGGGGLASGVPPAAALVPGVTDSGAWVVGTDPATRDLRVSVWADPIADMPARTFTLQSVLGVRVGTKGQPAIAVEADGSAVIAFVSDTDGLLHMVRRHADGTWTAPVTLPGPAPESVDGLTVQSIAGAGIAVYSAGGELVVVSTSGDVTLTRVAGTQPVLVAGLSPPRLLFASGGRVLSATLTAGTSSTPAMLSSIAALPVVQSVIGVSGTEPREQSFSQFRLVDTCREQHFDPIAGPPSACNPLAMDCCQGQHCDRASGRCMEDVTCSTAADCPSQPSGCYGHACVPIARDTFHTQGTPAYIAGAAFQSGARTFLHVYAPQPGMTMDPLVTFASIPLRADGSLNAFDASRQVQQQNPAHGAAALFFRDAHLGPLTILYRRASDGGLSVSYRRSD